MPDPPYHTTSLEYGLKQRDVYHDYNACPDGKRILKQHRVDGRGINRRRCDECVKMDGKGH